MHERIVTKQMHILTYDRKCRAGRTGLDCSYRHQYSNYTCLCLFVCLCLSALLSFCLSVCPSARPFTHSYTQPFIYLFVCLSFHSPARLSNSIVQDILEQLAKKLSVMDPEGSSHYHKRPYPYHIHK